MGLFSQLVSVCCLGFAFTTQASQGHAHCDNTNETDSGGDPCGYYDNAPHHCGCCDTPAFSSSGCCACQQSLVTGNSTWWTSVFLNWPRKARTLQLPSRGIRGRIPADIADRWTNLTAIDLSYNELTGSLPAGLGGLRRLQTLDLNNNLLDGGLPPELGNLTNLQRLHLDKNRLSGPVPAELGRLRRLQRLHLEGNQLSGSIPASLGNLRSLQSLYLMSNQLSGSIPAELGNLRSLVSMYLLNNQLSGSIPPELGNLTSLQLLVLSNNQLSGSIPAELGNLASLGWLVLDVNQLSGDIPAELGNLTGVLGLVLNNNQLTGIPPELGKLTNAWGFWLSSNQLIGTVPAEFGNLLSLEQLHLQGNGLSGGIPAELGNLRSLLGLHLEQNQLSGSIPPELGNLTSLLWLGLTSNQLSGDIPAELGSLTRLEWLSLGKNQLRGSIPAELGNLSSLQALVLEDNQLSGSLPPELGSLTRLRILHLRNNQLSGSLPSSFAGLLDLLDLVASRNPLLCGGAEVVAGLVNLTRLDLRGCCFQSFGPLPARLEHLDLGENLLTEVPRPWREQTQVPLSLRVLRLDGNRIETWDTSAVVPLDMFTAGRWLCGFYPTGSRLPWSQLEVLEVSGNPLNTSLYDFLASLSHLEGLSALRAQDADLFGTLPALVGDFVADVPHTGNFDCTGFPMLSEGFPALLTLDLSGNRITAVLASPTQWLVQADLSRNALTALSSQWWLRGVDHSVLQLDVTGNPGLQLPVLLQASSTCPVLGASDLTASSDGWSRGLNGSGTDECTTLCPMERARVQVDVTANESVLCRCTEGRGVGRDCSPCPDDTYSAMLFENGQYRRWCQACPANSHLRSSRGLCFGDCECSAGFYMAQISNGTVDDVDATPCSRLAPEGMCVSCGIFKTSPPGSRKASDCLCNPARSEGGWEGLLQREGRCGCPDGFHMNFQERSCVRCQAQEDCADSARSLEPPQVKPGFWALLPPPKGSDGLYSNFSRHSIWRCQSTAACPGNFACGRDLTGTACSLCRRGYFRTPSGGCSRCPRGPAETRALLASSLAGCMVFPILAHLQLRAGTGEPHRLALASRSLRTSLKQLLKFMQESMDMAMGFRWVLPLAGALVTCFVALLLTAFDCFLGCCCCRGAKEAKIRRLLRFRPLDVVRVMIFFLHLFFPSLLKNALLPLTCARSPNGLLTMNSYPNVPCFRRGFWTVASLGLAQSVLLSICFPLLLYFGWTRTKVSSSQDVQNERQRWWAFVFADLRPERAFWVLVATCKDILLNLIAAALPGLGTAQLLISSIISALYAFAVLRISPYPDVSNSILEFCTASSVAVLCLFTAGVGFQAESDVPSLEVSIVGGRGSSSYSQRAFSLVVLQGLSLACPAVILVFQLLMVFPKAQRCVPQSLRPLSQEQREEWSQAFASSLGLEGGPLPHALAELDGVDFAAFRQSVIRVRLAGRLSSDPRRSEGQTSETEESVPALHTRIAALAAENAALSEEVAGLSAENALLRGQIGAPSSFEVEPVLLGRRVMTL